MGSIASSQAFGNALSSLQGVTGQLVTNAQGQIIGTIPLMPNPVPSSQAAGGAQGLQVQPITPQLLTNAQGQIIATVIGNQILPVINTQGITLSPLKPGQQETSCALNIIYGAQRPSVTVYTLNVVLTPQKGFETTSVDAVKVLPPVKSTAHQHFFAVVFILS
ncbi:POU domain, class 6, transcription factor 2 [Grus japonensis]|uniref:POU domain, class 6, transcription factor 2 n=1 Tax=Grus japonensis TaxID=30415 RepID=A0ABC9WGJ3_GRUJA